MPVGGQIPFLLLVVLFCAAPLAQSSRLRTPGEPHEAWPPDLPEHELQSMQQLAACLNISLREAVALVAENPVATADAPGPDQPVEPAGLWGAVGPLLDAVRDKFWFLRDDPLSMGVLAQARGPSSPTALAGCTVALVALWPFALPHWPSLLAHCLDSLLNLQPPPLQHADPGVATWPCCRDVTQHSVTLVKMRTAARRQCTPLISVPAWAMSSERHLTAAVASLNAGRVRMHPIIIFTYAIS